MNSSLYSSVSLFSMLGKILNDRLIEPSVSVTFNNCDEDVTNIHPFSYKCV